MSPLMTRPPARKLPLSLIREAADRVIDAKRATPPLSAPVRPSYHRPEAQRTALDKPSFRIVSQLFRWRVPREEFDRRFGAAPPPDSNRRFLEWVRVRKILVAAILAALLLLGVAIPQAASVPATHASRVAGEPIVTVSARVTTQRPEFKPEEPASSPQPSPPQPPPRPGTPHPATSGTAGPGTSEPQLGEAFQVLRRGVTFAEIAREMRVTVAARSGHDWIIARFDAGRVALEGPWPAEEIQRRHDAYFEFDDESRDELVALVLAAVKSVQDRKSRWFWNDLHRKGSFERFVGLQDEHLRALLASAPPQTPSLVVYHRDENRRLRCELDKK
jgi:hypothetical protein